MARWNRGEAVVEQYLKTGELQRIQGLAANGEAWLIKARRTLETAELTLQRDPDSAYVLGYDAARMACTALLAHQGLRPTTKGGHLVVEQTVRAQFGDEFRPFRVLRIRRNELEYPAFPGELADQDEAQEALAHIAKILEAANKLIPHLGLF